MDDQRSLFDFTPPPEPVRAQPRPPDPVADPTFSVSGLNRAIESTIERSFPQEVWIRGEIQGLDRSRGRRHWYFELVEKDDHSDQQRSKIAMVCLAGDQPRLQRTVHAAPGFELRDNIEVRLRCRVRYFAPWGRLQLNLVDVDPAFTLGQMAANRERTLRTLRAEGLLDLNAQHELPLTPLSIGLITSVGSAAYNDFCDVIRASNLGFSVRCFDVRVQGVEVEATVLSALAYFRRHPPDVVALIRGGGAKSDLAGFDGEGIARAIAATPVPVWTGIGHEIDRSVADEVAHTAFITPTACARGLVEATRSAVDRIEQAWAGIVAESRTQLESSSAGLAAVAADTIRRTRAGLRHRERQLEQHSVHARRETSRSIERRVSSLRGLSMRTRSSVLVRLTRHEGRVVHLASALRPARLLAPLDHANRRLDGLLRGIGRASDQSIARARRELDLRASQVSAVDPARALARGFSLTYDAAGNLVRDPAALRRGDRLRTRVAHGEIHSEVTDPSPEEA